MNILADLESLKQMVVAQTGLRCPYYLYVTAAQAKEMIRQGALNPDDSTLMVWLSPQDYDEVMEFCRSLGREAGAIHSGD